MASPEQQEWKTKWLAKGLPETMLDAMITEANLEYESELGVWNFYRNLPLGVNIIDNDPELLCFYVIMVQRAEEVFYGHGQFEKYFLCAEIPTVEIVVHVFKLKVTNWITHEVEVFGYGETLFTHTKREDITVTVETVVTAARCDIFIKVRMLELHVDEIPTGDKTLSIDTSLTVT